MDKTYSEFVTYNGESPGNFVFCTSTDPIANCEGVLTTNLQPLETLSSQHVPAVGFDASLLHHKYGYNVPIHFRLHDVKLEKQQNLENHTMLQPIVICQETQTANETEMCRETHTQTQNLTEIKSNDGHEQYFSEDPRVQVAYCVNEKNKSENPPASSMTPNITIEVKRKSRQKVADPKSWSNNVRKTKHQRGEAYVNRRGKFVPEKRIKNMKDCRVSCKLHCSKQLSDTDRQHIFKAFYSLSSNEKKHFLLNTTERHCIKRSSKAVSEEEQKRKYTFKYFFLVRAIRYNVCKAFYLGTLAISQKPVYNVHMNKSDMNLPKPDGRGLAPTSSHSISEEKKDKVRKHIASFPAVDSNGSATSNRRKYLENGLNIKKMHKFYVEMCGREGDEPVKESMYRKIFNNEFNLHFKKVKVKIEKCENCKHPIKIKNS